MQTVHATATVMLVLASIAELARADDKPLSVKQGYNSLVNGMKAQRELLRTGILRATGRKSEESPGAKRTEGNVEVYCAFDFSKQRIRFDRTAPVKSRATQQLAPVRGQWVRTATESLSRLNSRDVMIQSSTHPIPGLIKPFDARTLGLPYADSGSCHTLEFFVKRFETEIADKITAEAKGVQRLDWTFSDIDQRRVLWLDVKNGYTPIRFEVFARRRGVWGTNPELESDCTWEKQADVWLPASFSVLQRRPSGGAIEQSLKFQWTAVNTQIDEYVFSPRGLDLNDGDSIVDRRGPIPIVVDKVVRDATDKDKPDQPR